MRKRLTEELVDALKPKAKRYVVMDSVVPWLGVRVSTSGRKSFVMVTRFNSKHPTRRALGKITLEQARAKASGWHRQLEQGLDPKAKGNTFGSAAEQFFAHIRHQRCAHDCERIVRRKLAAWWDRPISSITKDDAIKAIDAVTSRGKRCAAHQLLAHMRRVFNFAATRNMLDHAPTDRLKARTLIGPKVVRQRVLSDEEIRALWKASNKIGYPYGTIIQLLMLTGQRKSEVSGSRRAEFDLGKALWTIPSDRFKSNSTHVVPLCQPALAIIEGLSQGGDPLFACNGWSKAKRRIDTLMGPELRPWVIHDIRRTFRTRLSALRVPEHVAELAIGHSRRGLQRVYDQHHYLPELREAFDAWASALDCILKSRT